MRKTFLQTLNSVDHQIQDAPRQHIKDLIEASARTLVKRDGAIPTAVYLQEIADVCAVEHVLPIEHWKPRVTIEQPAQIEKNDRWRFVRWSIDWFNTHFLYSRSFIFLASFGAGWWWGIFTR